VPIALWLSEKENGTKTKITQEEFINTLESRLKACKVCLEINEADNTIEEKLHGYNEREKEDRNAINTYIIDHCIRMLEDKDSLTSGLELINKNPKQCLGFKKTNPEWDTPNLLVINTKDIKPSIKKEIVEEISMN
jgi:molecular chaperone GrpE (heat shock protein)